MSYRGRLAPSPTGYLHLGHARTFWIAQERARRSRGELLLRIDDLDRARCRPEFVDAAVEDLAWFGFRWTGEAVFQSQRMQLYEAAFEKLRDARLIYPCICSRRDVMSAINAPHAGDDEPIYPGTCRDRNFSEDELRGRQVNWRFRIRDGGQVSFIDGRSGPHFFEAGRDFGDFVVWRHDNLPSYQLAVVVDDLDMRITEVVRGDDLLRSTARQLLLYEAFKAAPPAFYHCALMLDASGRRLAKRYDSLSLRQLRALGKMPEELRAQWDQGATETTR
ncbi:MAG TPA: tRNA glutamyl-Q(34) synthetase GluQRS [Verrucomicrobiae bacterium]|nr:tRNA glutamyl-Q(34) synthetase GluQRS [Verrucomicrobiae bacterium]